MEKLRYLQYYLEDLCNMLKLGKKHIKLLNMLLPYITELDAIYISGDLKQVLLSAFSRNAMKNLLHDLVCSNLLSTAGEKKYYVINKHLLDINKIKNNMLIEISYTNSGRRMRIK